MNLSDWSRRAAPLTLAGMLIFAGCNIFSWADSPDEDVDLVAEGLKLMEEEDYEGAILKFEEAIAADSLNSDARFGHAKATLLAAGFTVLTIVNEISKFETAANAELPFLSLPAEEKDTLYVTNLVILDDLDPIFRGLTHGGVEKKDITIDMMVANSVVSILRFADTNSDGRIIVPPDIDLRITRNFAEDFTISGLDSLAPDLINALLGGIGGLLETSDSLLVDLLGGQDQIDAAAIDSLMADIGETTEWYFVNTGAPGNPGEGDNDNDGEVDEECLNGVDDDADGLVDEDSIVNGILRPDGSSCP